MQTVRQAAQVVADITMQQEHTRERLEQSRHHIHQDNVVAKQKEGMERTSASLFFAFFSFRLLGTGASKVAKKTDTTEDECKRSRESKANHVKRAQISSKGEQEVSKKRAKRAKTEQKVSRIAPSACTVGSCPS